ncbi:MAG TPA: MerR family transcriptional regulator [Draconibacterium sp.]|nr:MerR family transcriptional regulator [Draconibacterium sp.]HRX11929.1 MerR family transcriptional regulator [Draconibacterium sp.]
MKTEGYSIKDLEVLSGVKAHTIRIWEKRYNLLSPGRTDTNIRFYSDTDLRRILNVSLLVNSGYKISKVAKLDDQKIKNSVIEITQVKTSESDYVDRLILHMLNFDNIGFYNFVNEIIKQKGFEDAVLKVFFALFERIGTYWQVGTIFPAQEHYVTSILRQKLIAEIDKLGFENRNGSTILFFLPEGELHEMSLLFYSYLAQKNGYNVIYLGQYVPFEDLAKVQAHIKIDYVFTAFINAMPKEELEKYLVELKETFLHQKVFVTGWQINQNNPELPRAVKIIQDYKDFNKYLC